MRLISISEVLRSVFYFKPGPLRETGRRRGKIRYILAGAEFIKRLVSGPVLFLYTIYKLVKRRRGHILLLFLFSIKKRKITRASFTFFIFSQKFPVKIKNVV